ncbi:TPR-like protein [Athelia psychrophila]|uniref:TPR-like protein n=1 Tax=Athelia psychrophila TaxID=1759441 RepID=A0A166G978_9AGAM|nr:TPR-like protein [Fibularhizoctonia sp. CBS 109695]
METRQRLDHIGASFEVHPLPSLLPFNDAPVDLISSCFTGRHEDLKFIADALSSPTGRAPARCAIWGMPGLGKSQLGLKYAHSSFESGRHTHIFAISATTVEKLNRGLVGVLNLVQHPERHNSDQAAQLTAARHCFEHSEKYGFVQWLIIFDNATSETVAFLRLHLPRQNANGSIFITTRTLEIAEALTNVAGQQHPICELKALSPMQSAELLLKTAGIPSSAAVDIDSAQKLVKRMGYLPLAVEQAGALMKQNGFSSADRLNNLYDQHGSGEIIGWTNSLSTYEETSVLAAFTAPLQRLGEINPAALSFLRVLAYFDPEHIPLDIVVLGAEKARAYLASQTESTSPSSPALQKKRFSFRRLINKSPGKQAKPRPLTAPPSVKVPLELIPLLESICSEEWLRRACGHLKDLSLARPLYGEKTSLYIHDLIRQVIIQQTSTDHELGEDPYFTLAVALLFRAFSTIEDPGSPQCWAECERFVPHLMSLVNRVGALPIDLLGVLSVGVAWYFLQRGRYEEAAALCQHALAGQTQQLGADHPDTLTTVHRLASVYYCQGMYNEAEALYRRALASREQRLGADHPDTLTTVNNLAALYDEQGNLAEAEALYQRALKGQKQQLGADHPDTLRTVNNLAVLYDQQGNHVGAEALYQRALVSREQQLGANHPDTLMTVNNLAVLYDQQGKYAEAEALYQRALMGKEQQLGADHPDTLMTVHNIAVLYEHQRKHEEAETLYKQALAGQTQQLGADHLDTLGTVNILAELYRRQGKYDAAEALYHRTLSGREQQLGGTHRDTLSTVHNLAWLYEYQGKYGEAEVLYWRAMVGREPQLGADHRDTLETINNLAVLYERQGMYNEAEPLYQRALAGRERQLGADHPNTLGTVSNLAGLYRLQGNYDEAEVLFQRALAGREQQLGADHPDTLTTVHNLAALYFQQGEHDKADVMFRRALAGCEQQLGPDHPSTLTTVEGLAMSHEIQGKYDMAERLHKRALAGRKTSIGIHHPDTIRSMEHLAHLYDEQGRDGEASTLWARAEEAEKGRSLK